MGPARDEEVDRGTCRAEVVAQVLGKGFDGGFRGIVGWVAGWVGDTLLGTGDNNGRGCGVSTDRREKCGDAVDDAEEIGIYNLQN